VVKTVPTWRLCLTVFGVGPRKPFDITNEQPIDGNGSYELREPATSYEAVFRPENGDLRDENTFYPDKQKTPRSNREDECASVWSGCRPTGAVIRDHGLARGAPLGRYFLKINKLTWSDPQQQPQQLTQQLKRGFPYLVGQRFSSGFSAEKH